MPAANRQLAVIFSQMADILDILGVNKFKVIAFQKAARCLEELPDDVAQMPMEQVSCLEGIGKGMAARIDEFQKTGKVKEHEELLAQVPLGVVKMTRIPGLGPKTVALLWKEAGITDPQTLIQKIDSGELEHLPRMGKKKLEQIKQNLQFQETANQRLRIGAALPFAQRLVEQVRKFPGVERAEYAGSLRRGRETIGDIDIVAAASPEKAPAILKAFTGLDTVIQVIGMGDTKASTRMSWNAGNAETQVDLRVVPPDAFGAALMYFTGSKEHNVAMRQRAIDRDLRLNEYGLYRAADVKNHLKPEEPGDLSPDALPTPGPRGPRAVASRTEEEVYEALGLHWLPPELREGSSLKLAESGKAPKLIEIGDIKAELHAHTKASDGTWTIREWAEVAISRGFHTIAVTDHSKGQVQAFGLNEERLEKHLVEIRAVAAEMKGRITILAGTEVDILADGRLDYPDSLLKECDIVVASPHGPLKQDPDKATGRMLRAIENPYVTILGHPTGRLVNGRDGIAPDMKQLIKAAAARGIALEINANHHRLDLRDTHAKMALDAGCKLAINTDAHWKPDLDELIYGILTARRAGATKDDVINCLSRTGLAKFIASTRKG